MDIKAFGGEFKLIEAVTRSPRHHPVTQGVGDDCAVLPWKKGKYQIITKDMLIEEDHFSLRYFEPEEIGRKVVESNVSDIAAMGGIPLYAFIGISLRREISVEWVKRMYRGFNNRLTKHKIDLIGGDTTHASLIAISMTLVGEVKSKHLVLRRGASVGDVIKVSGKLGSSTAGLKLLQKNTLGHDWVKNKHKRPSCRLDVSAQIAQYATAMSDISDGLAADLGNILKSSGVGAVIEKSAIPISHKTFKAAEAIGDDAYDFALYGGEDFELIYTVPRSQAKHCPGIEIGEVLKGSKLFLKENDTIDTISRSGFDHFS